jgi:predicted RNase H-like nuclease (RuvC/YqgF family)
VQELVHEREALQKRVQEQLLQISALRNQMDEMRHYAGNQSGGNTTTSTTTTTAGDLHDQLYEVKEKLEKAEEEVGGVK